MHTDFTLHPIPLREVPAMNQKTRSIALIVLLAAAAAGNAEGLLDLIPQEAGVAFGVRNLAELKSKGDKFVKDGGLDEAERWGRPSQLVDLALGWLGVKAGLDEKGSVVAMVVDTGDGTLAGNLFPVKSTILIALPFTDLEAIASNYGLRAKDFDGGKICNVKGVAGELDRAGVHGKHLLIGGEDGIRVVRRRKSLNAALTAAERRTFGDADLLLYASPKPWGDHWTRFLDELDRTLKEGTDREGQELAEQLVASMRSVRFGLWSAHVDDGLALSMLAKWPEGKGTPAAKFLSVFAAEAGASKPAGLADRPAVFVQAMRGNGRQVARLFRLLAGSALLPRELSMWLPPPTERPALLAALSEVYKHVKGHRVAIYRNPDEAKHGLFSAVAVLETADGDKFVSDMKLLARLAGAGAAPGSEEDTQAQIEKLIRDLGADEFRTRESATDRLSIIGEKALPQLEKALKSEDAEVRKRARELHEQIATAALERRKTLVKEGPWKLQPSFAFTAPKKRDGRTIETARIGLSGKDAAYGDTLRTLLGPDWNRLRMATQRRHVVILWGSDETLLAETLANLTVVSGERPYTPDCGCPGLAESKQLADFRRHSEPGQMIEAHGSLEMLLSLLRMETMSADRQPKTPRMTSVGMQTASDRLRVDLWLPVAEIRAMRQAVINP
jgi:hypothetical protein